MQWKWGRRMAALKGKLLQDPRLVSSIKVGAGVIVLAIVMSALGGHASLISDQVIAPETNQKPASRLNGQGLEGQGAQDEIVAIIPTDVELWRNRLSQRQAADHTPKFVLVSGIVRSACGNTQQGRYCSCDQKLYINLGSYNDLAHVLQDDPHQGASPNGEHSLQKSNASASSQTVRHI